MSDDSNSDELRWLLDDNVAAFLASLPALCEHDLLLPIDTDSSSSDNAHILQQAPATADAARKAPTTTDALNNHQQSDAQQATKPLPQRRQRAKRSRNLARERMQNELKQLRGECADLETQFAELKRQRTLSEGEQLLLASWQCVEDQRTKRLCAERENEQLKQALAHQTALVASLKQSAQLLADSRAPSVRVVDIVRERMRPSDRLLWRACTNKQDAAVFASLVAEVDAAFAQTDSAFQAAGLRSWQRRTAHSPSRHSSAQLKTRRSETAVDGAFYVELVDARVHASAIDALLPVLWDCWEQQYTAANCVVYDLEAFAGECDIAARLTSDVVVDGACVSLEFLGASKLFVSASGAITSVWRSVSVPNSQVPGVCVNETGWGELRPTTDGGAMVLSLTHIETKTAVREPMAQPSLAVPLVCTLATSYDAEMESVSSAMAGLLHEPASSAVV